jgi:hypothetical protein
MHASSCLGPNLLSPVCNGLGGIGKSVFGAGANAALDALSSWVASGAAWLLGQVGGALDATTKVSLGAPWFLLHYRSMEGILALLALPMLLAAAIQALLQQRASLLARAFLVQLPLAMLLAGAGVELATMALSATDQLCAAADQATPGALGSLTSSLATSLTTSSAVAGPAMPSFVTMLCAALVAVAAVVLWVELVLRAAAIYVVVLFLPLALACSIWPALSAWCRRLVETLAALILSKLVVVVVLEAAVGALGTTEDRGFATIITGIALLVLASLAPFSLLKLLPMFEASAALHLEGLRQRGSASLTSGVPRQAAAAAVERLGASPALAVPAALSAASAATRGPSSLGSAGEASREDPMAHSAIAAAEPGASAPEPRRRPAEERGPGTDGAPEAGSLPIAVAPAAEQRPTLDSAPSAAAQRAASRRAGDLVLEHDELGPLIRMRPSPPSS